MKKIILSQAIIFLFVLLISTGCNNSQKEGKIPPDETTSTVETPIKADETDTELEQPKVETKIEESKKDKKVETKSQKNLKNNEIKAKTNTVPQMQVHEHNYIESVVATPTCTQNGSKVFTCSDCGASYSEQISALDHSFNGWTPDKTSHSHTCNRCGFSETKSHVWNLDGECSVCGIINFE